MVVTQPASHRGSLAPRYASDWISAGLESELAHEFVAVPVLWVHGNSRASFDYRIGSGRVPCNSRGFIEVGEVSENREFKPRLVMMAGSRRAMEKRLLPVQSNGVR